MVQPAPRKCCRSCVLLMVFCRQPLDYRVAPSSNNISPQPRPDPLVSCIATAWSYPTHICWLQRRTSTVAASRTALPTVRLRTGHPMFLFALFIPYVYVYIYIFFFFLRAHLFVLAPLSETSDGVGTIRPLGSRCRRFRRDPCGVSCVASPLNVFGLEHT